MAKIKVKLFGVYRIDTKTAEVELEAKKLKDVFGEIGKTLGAKTNSGLDFKDATIYVNGEACRKKSKKLFDGDEIWLLSPASGG